MASWKDSRSNNCWLVSRTTVVDVGAAVDSLFLLMTGELGNRTAAVDYIPLLLADEQGYYCCCCWRGKLLLLLVNRTAAAVVVVLLQV